MTDSTQSSEVTKTPPRKSANGWLILTGVLILAICVSWWINTVRLQRQQKDFQRQLTAAEQRYADEKKELMQGKAIALASAMSMVNTDLLTEDGQRSAQTMFVDLLRDKSIAYVALEDSRGAVTATSDLRLARDASSGMKRLTKVTVDKDTENGADFVAVGPVTDSTGDQIGTVRIGVVVNPKETK